MSTLDAMSRPPKIDSTFLNGTYPSHTTDGVYAEWYPDGHLRRIGRVEDGEPVFTLELDGYGNGRGVLHFGSGGTADWEVYKDGKWERFDAWSDNTRPRPFPYTQFVREWIRRIE